MISTIISYGGAEFTYTVNVDPLPQQKRLTRTIPRPLRPISPRPLPSDPSDPSGNGDLHSRTVHNSGRTAAIVIGAVCAAATVAVAAVLIIKAHNIRKTK